MTHDETMDAIVLVAARHEEMGLEADEAIDEIISIIRDRE